MESKKAVKQKAEEKKTVVMKEVRDMTERIREFAYSLYEKGGYVQGNDRQDWFQAEKTVHDR
jgi:hypothetical protein